MSTTALAAPRRALRRPSRPVVLGAGFAAFAALCLLLPDAELSGKARLAFVVFGGAVLLWVASDVDDTVVALVAAMSFAVLGVDQPGDFFSSLGDASIWLLLGAFVIAAAARATGLAHRLAVAVAAPAGSVEGLCWRLAGAMLVTAFVIPSTSGRAALMVPIFVALAGALEDRRAVRALALLIPTVILLSAVASLTGAGAHLVTSEILEQTGHGGFSYAEWALYGVPFALVSTFGSTWVLLRLFLTREERRRPVALRAEALAGADPEAPAASGPLSRAERWTLGTLAALVLLWATETVHGLDATLVALLGALVVTAPAVGALSFKQAVKTVDWRLLLFMAATLELGEALIESGGAEWLVREAFAVFAFAGEIPTVAIAVVVALSLLSHLVINSRTARSSVLIPVVILLAASLDLDARALAFASTAAAGFCLTLPVSAKPVLLFSSMERETFAPRDLLRLTKVLLPLHLILIVVFAALVWPAMGLESERPAARETQPPAWVDERERRAAMARRAAAGAGERAALAGARIAEERAAGRLATVRDELAAARADARRWRRIAAGRGDALRRRADRPTPRAAPAPRRAPSPRAAPVAPTAPVTPDDDADDAGDD